MLSQAYFQLSRSKVLDQYNIMNNLADEVLYSYKTNNEVGKILEEENKNFCIITIDELMLLNKQTREKIWFCAQSWDKEEIKKIMDEGVRNFIVDNIQDYQELISYIEKANTKINLLLRMRLKEYTIHTGKYFVFGLYSRQVKELLPKIKEHNLINKIGIHFHRKTQNIAEWSLKEELESAIGTDLLSQIDIVDIGGGVPIPYKNFKEDIINNILDKIKNLKTWLNSLNIKMFIEPGRFISGPAVKLIANVKNVYDNNVIVDCSIYNSAMNVFDSHIRYEIESEIKRGDAYTIKGSTPDAMDIFRYRVYLKEKPKKGDKIIFLNVGAYAYATEFCNVPKLKTVIVK